MDWRNWPDAKLTSMMNNHPDPLVQTNDLNTFHKQKMTFFKAKCNRDKAARAIINRDIGRTIFEVKEVDCDNEEELIEHQLTIRFRWVNRTWVRWIWWWRRRKQVRPRFRGSCARRARRSMWRKPISYFYYYIYI